MTSGVDADTERRDTLLRHRGWLENARLSASRDRDQMILAIAGGSLAVSIAFLEPVGKGFGLWQGGLLFIGWLTEVVAIVLVLRSLRSSERALERERERVDCMLQNDGRDPGWNNPATQRTEFLNNAAAFLAVAGVVVLLAQAAVGLGVMASGETQSSPPSATTSR